MHMELKKSLTLRDRRQRPRAVLLAERLPPSPLAEDHLLCLLQLDQGPAAQETLGSSLVKDPGAVAVPPALW